MQKPITITLDSRLVANLKQVSKATKTPYSNIIETATISYLDQFLRSIQAVKEKENEKQQ